MWLPTPNLEDGCKGIRVALYWLLTMCQTLDLCGQLNNGPKDISVLTPGTYECGLYGKRSFANASKLKILRCGNYPGLSREAWNVITHDLTGGGRGRWDGRRGEGEVTTGAVRCENGGSGHKPWNEVITRSWTVKESNSPLEPPEGTSCANTLTIVRWDLFQTFDIQKCKRINLCFLSPIPKWAKDLNRFFTITNAIKDD